ncbi:unnamed protein product [Sphagnum tenellum]
MRIVDLGAGPGTASISLLLLLLNQKLVPGKSLPQIELEWFDIQETIMADGKALVEQLANNFPKLRGRVKVTTHVSPWWKAASHLLKTSPTQSKSNSPQKTSLILIGHALNESHAPAREVAGFWEGLIGIAGGGGILMVEPAARRPSQNLSELRDHFFESEILEPTASRIWGPCIHAGKCPLAAGYRKYDSRVSTADISVPLLKVSSDAMDGTLILQLVTDSMNNLQELKYVRADNVTVDMHPADLLRGVVLMSNKDPITGRAFDVLKLIAHDIRPESGGDLELSYLSNRFGWRYASFFMTLLQTQGSWSLQTQDSSGHKTQFNTMYLKKRTLANVTVGIKSVSVSFQASH